jgi:hypothetical protein
MSCDMTPAPARCHATTHGPRDPLSFLGRPNMPRDAKVAPHRLDVGVVLVVILLLRPLPDALKTSGEAYN